MRRPEAVPGKQISLSKLGGVPSGQGRDATGGDEDYRYRLCCASSRDAQHQGEKLTAASGCGETQIAKYGGGGKILVFISFIPTQSFF